MKTITLPYGLDLREYQQEAWNTFLAPDFMRGIQVWPRRNGKDLVDWNVLIAKAMQKPALYYYIAPYYNQVRQIIWEGFSGERRFLDYLPYEIVKNKTKLDMRIDLVNGSQIKLQGSDAIDRIVGTNPYGIVFTEFSLHKPEAWEYLRPILAENGGWAIFNGTPRGMNHFFDLFTYANSSQGTYRWLSQLLTRDDTGSPTLEAIEEDRRSGMPEELIQQEYYCSFTSGSVGSYYADIINKIRAEAHITRVPYEPRLPVYTAWDLGRNDATAIWFIQSLGREYRVIDYYEENGKSLQYHIKKIKERHYTYADHFGPFDLEVVDYTADDDLSRREKAAALGVDFTTIPRHPLEDRHDAVRDILWQCYFDSAKTSQGLAALQGYQKKYDAKNQAYADTPLRNWAKHGADSFGQFAMGQNYMDNDFSRQIIRPKSIRAYTPRIIRAMAA